MAAPYPPREHPSNAEPATVDPQDLRDCQDALTTAIVLLKAAAAGSIPRSYLESSVRVLESTRAARAAGA